MGPGENAGVVDVGDGLAVAFKVESHNHPSAVEPFQGAATGVGGILRDIFAVGARPIAVLDSLRFGELDSPRSRYLFDWAVKGIGHYGNSIGVPTVGGEVLFEPAYEQNCLVNAMCVGLAPPRAPDPQRGGRGGQPARAAGRAHRARRDRRRVGAGQRRAVRRGRLQAPDRADRRPVRGVEADRVLPGAAGARDAGVAAGPGRRRAVLVVVGDGVQGRGRARPRRGARAAARGRHGALRDHDLRVAGAHAVRGRARRGSASCARCASAGTCAPPRSGRSPTRAGCACSTATSWSATCRSRRSSTTARCTTSSREPPDEPIYPDPPARLAAGRRLRRDAARAARRALDRLEAVRLRAVRPDRRLAHRAPAAGRRRRRADAGQRRRQRRDRGLDRRQRAAGGVRPVHRRGRGRARVRPQPGLRGRRAARPDQLPQLRQPREAAHRLAADARGGGAARRLPGARRAGRGRQRLALQRGRRRPDLPDADRGHGRQRCPTRRACRGSASRRRATRWRWSGRSSPALDGLGAGEAARAPGRLAARGGPGRAGARRWPRCATAVRGGALATVHDVSEGGLAVALAECCIEGGLGASVGRAATRPRCSARARAAW